MAATLTEEQENQLAKILKLAPYQIRDQVTYLSDRFTAQVATDIAAEITRWVTNSKGSKFVRVAPVATNKGVDYDPDDEKSDIRSNIAVLLERPDWADANGISQAKLYRG